MTTFPVNLPTSPGAQLNAMLDALGLPDQMGDILGAALDAKIGDVRGAIRNLFDLYSGLSTSQMNLLFGSSLAPFGFVPRPHVTWERQVVYKRHTYHQRVYLKGKLNLAEKLKFFGLKALFGGVKPSDIEKKIMTEPKFRAYMERKLGGKILYDGTPGGVVTVEKQYYTKHVHWRKRIHWHVGNFLNRIAKNISRIAGSLLGAIGGLPQKFLPTTVKTPSAGSGASDIQGILNDPGLSLEDKIALVLAKMAEKKEKEIMDKMKEWDKMSQKGGKGGIGSFLSGIGKLFGGVAGAFLGGPLGIAIGSSLGGSIGKVLGGSQSAAAGGKKSEQRIQAEIQLLSNKLQRLMTMLSNIMKSFHDSSMAAIRNIR